MDRALCPLAKCGDGHKPAKYARMSGLRLPKSAAERTHRGKIRAEKTTFAVEGGCSPSCACRRTRRSERIAARYGRKRKLPSRWKADAGRAVIAEERGGLDVSRQDTEGKENRLRSGRRTPVGLRLPKCVADWTYRGKIRAEKKTTFAVEGGCRRGYDCRRTRRSERIAARYGRKRKLPSQVEGGHRSGCACRSARRIGRIAEDTDGKENRLRSGRRTPPGL